MRVIALSFSAFLSYVTFYGRFLLFRSKLVVGDSFLRFFSLRALQGTRADRRDASGDRGGVRRDIRGRREGPSLRLCQVGRSFLYQDRYAVYFVVIVNFRLLCCRLTECMRHLIPCVLEDERVSR